MRGLNYLRKLFERGIMFAVTHIDIQFLNPARYADTIDVISTMTCKRNVASDQGKCTCDKVSTQAGLYYFILDPNNTDVTQKLFTSMNYY